VTVGIGRIVENPIDQAISVLLASDADGQGRVQDALRSGLSLRRRIAFAGHAVDRCGAASPKGA